LLVEVSFARDRIQQGRPIVDRRPGAADSFVGGPY
jgi:hypothetical protein